MPSATRKKRVQSDLCPAIDWWENRHRKLRLSLQMKVKDQYDWGRWCTVHDGRVVHDITIAARLAQYYIEVKGYALDQIMGDAIGEAAPNVGVNALTLALAIEALSVHWVYCDEFRRWLTVSMKMPRPVIVD